MSKHVNRGVGSSAYTKSQATRFQNSGGGYKVQRQKMDAHAKAIVREQKRSIAASNAESRRQLAYFKQQRNESKRNQKAEPLTVLVLALLGGIGYGLYWIGWYVSDIPIMFHHWQAGMGWFVW